MGQAGHETDLDGVGDVDDDDRDGRRRVLGGHGAWIGRRDQDIDAQTHELGRELRDLAGIAVIRTVLDRDVLAFGVAELAESFEERLDKALSGLAGWRAPEVADAP